MKKTKSQPKMIWFNHRGSRLLFACSAGSNRSMTGSDQFPFFKRVPKAAFRSRRPSLSIWPITAIHYFILICIMIAVGASWFSSSESVMREHRLKSNSSTHYAKFWAASLENLNNKQLAPKKVPNNQKSLLSNSNFATQAMSSVHSSKPSSLMTEQSRKLIEAFRNSRSTRLPATDRLFGDNLNEKKSNNQIKRSLGLTEGEINNLTYHQNTVRAVLSPLLSKSSTLPAPIINENVPRQVNGSIKNNSSEPPKSEKYSLPSQIAIVVVLLALIIVTTIGNIFVIAAICLDKNLQSAQNYLVLSLAVADLLVALLVMPPGMVYEVYNYWVLGSKMCTFWNLVDCFCCTASILHLLAIALDRYRSVSSLHYSQGRSLQRIVYVIIAIWVAAAVVSMPPLLGVKDAEYDLRLQNGKCLMSQDMGYQIFATMSTFYVPSVIILFLYWGMYQVARKRIRNKPGNQASIEQRQRTFSGKEDKTESFKRANINTISSRVTMANTMNIKTSSFAQMSSEASSTNESKSQLKELRLKDPHHKDIKQHSEEEGSKQFGESDKQSEILSREQKQSKEPEFCQCNLLPNNRVPNSSLLEKSETKLKQENDHACFEEVFVDKRNMVECSKAHDENGKLSGMISSPMMSKGVLNDQEKLLTNGLNQSSGNDTLIRNNRRFQTKYKFIDEDEHNEFQTISDTPNNSGENLQRLNIEFDPNNNNKFTVEIYRGQFEGEKYSGVNSINNVSNKLDYQLVADKLEKRPDANMADGLTAKTKHATNKKNLHNGKASTIVQADSTTLKKPQRFGPNQTKELPSEFKQTNVELNARDSNSSGDCPQDHTERNRNIANSSSSTTDRGRKSTNKSSTQTIGATASTTRIKNHSSLIAKRERKTAKVLAIITALIFAMLSKNYLPETIGFSGPLKLQAVNVGRTAISKAYHRVKREKVD